MQGGPTGRTSATANPANILPFDQDRAGKWQLFVSPVDDLVVVNLLPSPTGDLSNLSTAIVVADRLPPEAGPETGFGPPRVINDHSGDTKNLQLVDLDGDGNSDLLTTFRYAGESGQVGLVAWL